MLKFNKSLFIVLVWIFNGIYFSVYQYLISKPSSLNELLGYGSGFMPLPIIMLTTITGLMIAAIEILTSQKELSRLPLGKLILIKAGMYITGFIVLSLIFIGYLQHMRHDLNNFNSLAAYALQIFNDADMLFVFISMLSIFIITLLLIHANYKFTPRHFLHYVMGKYHSPKIENRIFMFLDLKSSTTIAERLGAVKYHEFLYDFYYMITSPIISRNGEIYQYVGDEISVTWKIKNGVKDNNCIKCFFDISDVIEKNSDFFLNKYGFVPEFKAGFHYGETVIGEIGVVKSEIVFSGDVVNTTARIQELCNSYKQKILISQELLNTLKSDEEFTVNQIGALYLRGKNSETSIYSINKSIKEIAA